MTSCRSRPRRPAAAVVYTARKELLRDVRQNLRSQGKTELPLPKLLIAGNGDQLQAQNLVVRRHGVIPTAAAGGPYKTALPFRKSRSFDLSE